MRLTIKTAKINFDKKQVTKHSEDAIDAAVRDATREFYRAAFTSVPVRTGMARGSLIPLGRFIRNVPTTISPTQDPVVPYAPRAWYPAGKSLQAGISAGAGAYRFNKQGLKFTFEYNIKVLHWLTNDTARQWNALENGREAFRVRLLDGRLSKELRGIFRFGLTGRK